MKVYQTNEIKNIALLGNDGSGKTTLTEAMLFESGVRAIGAIAGVLLCGATTALAGPIGFIGLMVPHFMRLVCGENLKLLLPCSALGGSVLLVICDVIGRVVLSPSELEVGIITALIGAPIFILVVKKARVKGL